MRTLLLSLTTVLALAVIWWLAWSGDPSPGLRSAAAEPASVSAASGSESDRVHAAPAAMQRAAAPVLVEALAVPPADAVLTEITVVDRATGAAVADADVLWTNGATALAMRRALGATWWLDDELGSTLGHEDAAAERFGLRATTDAQGKVWLPLSGYNTVIARRDHRYGQLVVIEALDRAATSHRLELEPDLSVAVLVHDYQGQPLGGAPVVVYASDERGEAVYPVRSDNCARTADSGIAVLRHLQMLRQEGEQRGTTAKQVVWRVRCRWSPSDDPGAAFSIDAPPREPIVLRLPATGSLRVVAQLAGHPDGSLPFAELTEVAADGEVRGGHRAAPGKRDADGSLRWRYVPLGRRFRLVTWFDNDSYPTFAGPTLPGQEVIVELVPNAEAIVWCGRLLDAAHQPLGSTQAQLQWSGPSESVVRAFATDADGRFAVHLMDRSDDPEEHVVDSARVVMTLWDGLAPAAALPACTLEPGVRDLGDVVLKRGQLVVGGRFVAAGAPMALTGELMVEAWRAPIVADGERDPVWVRVLHLLSHVDGKGRFEVRGVCPAGRLRLQMQPHNALPIEPVEFALGASDLVVEVAPAASLTATVQLPSRDELRQIVGLLVADAIDPATSRPFVHQAQVDSRSPTAWVHWQAVPSGRYSLVLRHELRDEPLLQLDEVLVPPPPGGDARLQAIDLRSQLRALVVRLVDDLGRPVAAAGLDELSLLAAPSLPDGLWRRLHMPSSGDGTRSLLLPRQLGLLQVAATGYQPMRVPSDVDDVELRLLPWPRQVLLFPDLPSSPPGCHAVVRLVAADAAALGACHTQWGSSPVAEWLRPMQAVAIVEGRAEVAIGDGLHRIEVLVEGPEAVLRVERVAPAGVVMSAAPISVSIPLDAWAATCAEVVVASTGDDK